MKIRILQVFFGADGLPYKDQARTVHYPITGNGFQNANNTTQIRFYFSQLSGENTTWVAVSKLPNGKVGSKVLETFIDDELNEPYALLELDSYYTQYKGDIFISLQGYQGGVQVTYDEETKIYEISGTPTIAATGSVKFTNNYAPSFVGSGQEQNITIQQLLGYLSSKADIGNTIYVVSDIEDEDLSGYENGQVIYDLFSDLYYEVNSQVQGGHVLANENGLLGNKGALIRFFGLTNTITLQQIYNLIGANRYGALNISGKEYLVIMSANNSIKAYDLLEKKLYSYLDAPDDTFADVLNETPTTFVEHTQQTNRVYGTNQYAQETTILYSVNVVNNGIVQRGSDGQINVPTNPAYAYNAASKNYVDSNYGKKVQLTIDNDTFVLTVKLLNNNDVVISQANVDLPLESIVVSAQYYDTYTYQGTTYTKVLVIVLATTSEPIIIPVGDLVSGLVSETTFNNAVAQLQTNINKCVQQTNTASIVYGTNGVGGQKTINYGTGVSAHRLVQRDAAGQINVSATPSSNSNATSKQYVDTFGRTLDFSINNTTYVMTFRLKDNNGNVISTQTIDLPLETVVVDGYYDSENENLVLELKNGNKITIPISDLISGLVTETSLATTLANYYTKSQIDQMVAGFVFADVDDYLSDSSTNPVENRVITGALETKANVDGNYPTMSVGEANDLSTTRVIDNPEDSCPPIVMGVTGGNAEIRNGLQKFQYMEGASEVFNQLHNPFVFSSTFQGIEVTQDQNGLVTINGTTTNSRFIQLGTDNASFTLIKGHKYLVYTASGGGENTWKMFAYNGNYYGDGWINTTIFEATQDFTGVLMFTVRSSGLVFNNFKFYAQLFDLTLMYGAGNEPTTVAEFKAKYPNDYYAYNAGTILDAQASALISRKRQQWDEVWEVGGIDDTTGQNIAGNNRIRSTNYIPVIGGQTYYVRTPKDSNNDSRVIFTFFYDANKNFLQRQAQGANATYFGNQTFTVPYNASYMRFYLQVGYGTTYNHDITISIYFEDGDGYDQYYPYEAQTVELPNIELRAIGNIKDIAYAQGGGKRRIGIVDLGTLNWSKTTGTYWRFSARINDIKMPSSNASIANILCSIYQRDSVSHIYAHTLDKSIGVHSADKDIWVYDNAYENSTADQFKTAMSGVYLLYELATETELTENQGWVENVIVDNYGTLEFTTSPQQIPQVKQPYFIEYTISLKEFLDGTYQRASGNPQNIALVEDVDQLKQDIEEGQVIADKSLVTEQIENVSEESGSIQSEPFVYQGSGTNNGSDIVDTSPVAKQLEKQGNSVVVNQLVKSPNPYTVTSNGVTFTYNSDGSIHVSGTATGGLAYQNIDPSISIPSGHKVLVRGCPANKGASASTWWGSEGYTNIKDYGNGAIATVGSNTTYQIFVSEGITLDVVFKPQIIDLTKWFGSNDAIPQDLLDHPENFFRYYNGSLAYNTGTLVDSDGQYLECGQSRNVWDEEWELGSYNNSTGVAENNNSCIRSKQNDYILVIPNSSYHLRGNSNTNWIRVFFYDKDKNFINSSASYFGSNITTPLNCSFIRFYVSTVYGSTYNHDITISIYYTPQQGGEGYDQYYPYIAPKVYDTGNEPLRSVPNGANPPIRDRKLPSGEIDRPVGYKKLKELSWGWNSNYNCFVAHIDDRKINASSVSPYQAYVPTLIVGYDYNYYLTADKTFAYSTTADIIYIKDAAYGDDTTAFKNHFTDNDYIYYELAEPTEEQGTPFAENIEINDYSYMAWKNADGYVEIPQGCKIFYPADYVLFIDSLYSRSKDGGESADVNNFVLQSERTADKTAQATLDSQLKENIGGILRHQLASASNIDFANTKWIDLGEQNWYYNSGTGLFELTISDIKVVNENGQPSNLLCPKFVTLQTQWNSYSQIPNEAIWKYVATSGIRVKDTAYTNTTAFKNAMKGVLLAYEKAS